MVTATDATDASFPLTDRRRRARGAFRGTAALAALVILAGCADPNNTTRAEGAGLGAAAGALAGGLLGGRNGALLGAAIGGGLGLAGAEFVNSKRRDYANNEDRLAHEQQVAQANLRSARNYNTELANQIAELDRRAYALRMAQAQGQAVNVQLVSARNTAASETQQARKRLYEVNSALAESERNLALARSSSTAAEEPELARLEREVADMEGERNRLQDGVDRLEAAESRL